MTDERNGWRIIYRAPIAIAIVLFILVDNAWPRRRRGGRYWF